MRKISLLSLFFVLALLGLSGPALADNPKDQIIVRYKSSVSGPEKKEIREGVEADLVDRLPIVSGLEVIEPENQDQALRELRSRDDILYAYRNARRYMNVIPNDDLFSLQWGMRNTGQIISGAAGVAGADGGASGGWSFAKESVNTPIAIIDSGIDIDHPDLSDNIWTNPDEIPGNGIDDDSNGYVDDIHGWNFAQGNNNVDDTDGHGTHVAGVVGARGNNLIGVSGVNWRTKMVALKVCEDFCYQSSIIAAIEYAVSEGIRVSNNSYGGGGYYQPERDAIEAARLAGHLYVAAAGNDGVSIDTNPSYPASYNLDNIVSVASTTNQDTLSSFSNYGTTSVDLGAPGSRIVSTYKNGTYVYLSGTSMASPFVAGVANLLAEMKPSWGYDDIKSRLMTTARPISALSGKSQTGGVVDAEQALDIIPATPVILDSPDSPKSITNQTSASFFWTGDSEDTFKCSLDNGAWEVCSSPKLYTSISEGDHTFRVKAINALLSESEIATFAWKVDTTPPPAPLFISRPSSESRSPSAQFSWSGSGSYLCKIDSGSYTSCAPPVLLKNLSDGNHTFSVKAKDGAGNVSPASSFSWLIDSTPPQSPNVISAPAKFIRQSSAQIQFEAEGFARCQINGGSFSSCSSPIKLSRLRDGKYSVSIKSSDSFGNTSQPTEISFTVDKTRPVVLSAKRSFIRKGLYKIRWFYREKNKLSIMEISTKRSRPNSATTGTKLVQARSNPLRIATSSAPRWIRIKDRAGNWSFWKAVF